MRANNRAKQQVTLWCVNYLISFFSIHEINTDVNVSIPRFGILFRTFKTLVTYKRNNKVNNTSVINKLKQMWQNLVKVKTKRIEEKRIIKLQTFKNKEFKFNKNRRKGETFRQGYKGHPRYNPSLRLISTINVQKEEDWGSHCQMR